MIRKILACLCVVGAALFSHAQTAGNATATVKATAKLAAVCTISSQNVNFGQLSLPVGSQSATGSISVQCTKGSSFTIGLAYGGVYGTQQSISATYTLTTSNPVYSGGGPSSGSLQYYTCAYTATADGQTSTLSGVIGSAMSGCPATDGAHTFSVAYNYGKLIGASKGDNVAYSIQVPGKPSEVWNVGNYSYSSTGTGANQSIPVVATLVPAQTTDKYPAADSYLDTVTATITY